MLPTRLELRNFLAYRAPEPILFDGIDLACLTGQNGVGKSSILDAITWALWGRARAKRDDDLIHLGQNEMQVSIDFEQDGLRYRVLRRRSRTGRASRSALDLMVWGANDQPRIINDDGIRKTQDKLNAILHLDYETFVHSAYLQQGKADAFTLKTAAERKRILSDILGLDQWADYEEAAKTRLSEIATLIDILEHDISRIETEIAHEPQLKAELAAITAELNQHNEDLNEASERYNRVANSAAALARERQNLLAVERLIAGRHDDIAAAEAEIERQAQKIATYEGTIAQGETIESGYQQLLDARSNQSALAEQLAQIQDLDRRRHELESALTAQRTALIREADVVRERISGLDRQRSTAADADIEALRLKLSELRALEAQRNALTKALEQGNLRRAELRTRLKALTETGQALNDRLERLEMSDGATCPLCGGALTSDHRDEMLADLERERESMREDYSKCRKEVGAINDGRRESERELEALALQLKDLPALQGQLGAAVESARKAEAADADMQMEMANLSQLEARLDSADFGRELRQQLRQVNEQRGRIAYDPDSHADIKTQLETYAAFDRQHTQLEFARLNRPEAQATRAATRARLGNLRATLDDDERERERVLAEIAALEDKVVQEREFRAEVETIRAEVAVLNERRTIHAQELNAIAAGRESRKRLATRLKATRHEQGLFSDLRAAFGRNGLPAMIIDTAIPELEAEANELLSRMTDGRMTLRLSTQRERISGGMAETLDVEIADELGTRAYELYSGGESFRINFAIRIALSKLLARRAGARLRTLFIDEGFGTQDEAGQSKLVDAISKIAADFDLVLVITHIDELRQAFPVHLVVEKTPNGSIVTAQ